MQRIDVSSPRVLGIASILRALRSSSERLGIQTAFLGKAAHGGTDGEQPRVRKREIALPLLVGGIRGRKLGRDPVRIGVAPLRLGKVPLLEGQGSQSVERHRQVVLPAGMSRVGACQSLAYRQAFDVVPASLRELPPPEGKVPQTLQ